MEETEANNYLEKTPLILPRTPDDLDRPDSFTRESERASKVLTFDQAMARAGGLGKGHCHSCCCRGLPILHNLYVRSGVRL